MPFLAQLAKFGAVGGVGVVVNLAVFNALLATVWNTKQVHLGAIYASIVATLVAIAVNWVGNRYWAFRENRQKSAVREGAEFFAVSLAALLIPLACVWVSHYLLHLESQLADTIANNVVGLALGTAFRFALYRWWVYSPRRAVSAASVAPDAVALVAAADASSAAQPPETPALPRTSPLPADVSPDLPA